MCVSITNKQGERLNRMEYSCDIWGCIDPGLACNGELDCPDGSDELPDVCKYFK